VCSIYCGLLIVLLEIVDSLSSKRSLFRRSHLKITLLNPALIIAEIGYKFVIGPIVQVFETARKGCLWW